MAAEAAVEIVREIAAVGAADLAAAAEPLRADCLRLARKVSLLSHLVAEVAEAGEGDAAAAAWVRELVRALEAARRFVDLGRAPPTPTAAAGASDQVRRCWEWTRTVTWSVPLELHCSLVGAFPVAAFRRIPVARVRSS